MTMIYCKNCKKCGRSKPKGNGWITLILILFYIVPGLIYIIWRYSGLGACRFCSSTNVIPASEKPATQIPNNQSFKPVENVKQVNCPDCRELIRFDAKKCKHCGSFINNHNNCL